MTRIRVHYVKAHMTTSTKPEVHNAVRLREVRAEERQPERDEDGEHPDEGAPGSSLTAVHLDHAETVASAAGARQTQTDVVTRGARTCPGVPHTCQGVLHTCQGVLDLSG